MKTKHILLAVVALLVTAFHGFGHGTMANPVSRVYQVFLENPENPSSAAARAAVAVSGPTPFYTWNEVARLVPQRNYRDLIPDGRLASAGLAQFAGLDLARADWPATPVQAGPYDCVFYATTPHEPSSFAVFITRQGYDPLQPLRWDDLEQVSYAVPPYLEGRNYRFTVNLPPRAGRHVLYVIWQRDDPAGEAFFSASDVDFGGVDYVDSPAPEKAPVDGYCGTGCTCDHEMPMPPDRQMDPEPTPAPAPDPVTPPAATAGALAVTHSVTSSWGSGGEVLVTLSNPGTAAVNDWSVEFDYPANISSLWNANLTTASGSPRYQVTPPSWSNTVGAGQSVTFGFIYGGASGAPALQNLVVRPALSGDPVAPTPAPTPVPTPAPAPTPQPAPQPEPPVTGSPDADFTVDGVRVEFRVGSDWGSGLTASVRLVNTSAEPVTSWTLAMDLATTPGSVWDTAHTRSGGRSEFRPVGWNATIPAGGSVSFGFNAAPGNLVIPPANVTVSGAAAPQPVQPGPQPLPEPEPEVGVPTPTPTPDPVAPVVPVAPVNPAPVTGGNPPPIDGPKIVGYFVEWGIYGRNYNVTDIPADKLNVINYAFADISPAGEVVIYDRWAAVEKAFPGDSWEQMPRGNYNQLRKLKEKHPHLVTMISVGGWTLSGRFSDVALTAESREKFARSAVAFILEHGFDGVDIDWEYPVGGGLESNKVRPEDKRNYTLLLRELRRQLDARGVLDGRKYYLSIASPGGDDKIRNLEPVGIAEACDWVNIMTYDFAGGWDKKTGHQAAMFSPDGRGATNPSTLWTVDGAVRQFLDAGVDPKKLVVGVPFYGRGWIGVPATNSGIGQLSTGLPSGSYEAGIYDYKDLVAMTQAQPEVYPVFEDSKAEATFLYAPSANGLWVSFDDTQIVQRKVDYIKDLGLGGAMFWELSGDTTDPSTSLLEVLYQGLKPGQN
jgi:GH18 family chitinase/predicted carbohydrate-binding protein with CBM5 and CBM33 domain